jgi:hypothetical protein
MSKVKIELFKEIVEGFMDTYIAKNSDYGDSFAKVREEYPHAIAIRLTDKLERLKMLLDKDYEQQVHDESIDDTLKDLAVYSIMELMERELDNAYEEVMRDMNDCSCEECEEFYTSGEQAKEELLNMLKEKYGDDVQIKFVNIKE